MSAPSAWSELLDDPQLAEIVQQRAHSFARAYEWMFLDADDLSQEVWIKLGLAAERILDLARDEQYGVISTHIERTLIDLTEKYRRRQAKHPAVPLELAGEGGDGGL